MKKYSFLVYYKEYETFLESIRNQGVLHVKETGVANVDNDELLKKTSDRKLLADSIKFLEKHIDKNTSLVESEFRNAQLIVEELGRIQQREVQIQQSILNYEKELSAISPWGDFSWESIAKIEAANWNTQFLSCPEKEWNEEWAQKHNVFVINTERSICYFVVFTPVGADIDIEADLVQMPTHSLTEIEREISILKTHYEAITNSYQKLAASELKLLRNALVEIDQEIELCMVNLNTTEAVDNRVLVLEGFIPITKEKEFVQFLENEMVFYRSEDPMINDNVPILLKNNRFNRLFETIGELYTLPNHKELDLTPYFAPFYWLFFGMCLSDFGYGLILALGGFIMTSRVAESLKGPMKLVGYLGISTMIFGALTGTCFGMNLYEMRFAFYGILDDKIKATGLSLNQYLFYFSLLLGAIQILFGMVVKAANEKHQFGIRYAFSTIGWLFIIVGFIVNYGLKKFGFDPAISQIVFIGMLSIGFLGAFVFNSPDRNIFANLGMGIWDTYNMATGLMGDILSYIRLFALGVSSSILGYVFNSLAISLAPKNIIAKILVMTVILLIGHTLNFLMGILGSFVHPMRLTFVEFYKNSGFTGGGKKYKPFNKQVSI